MGERKKDKMQIFLSDLFISSFLGNQKPRSQVICAILTQVDYSCVPSYDLKIPPTTLIKEKQS